MQLWQLRAKVHVSWLIAVGCMSFLLGVIVAPSVMTDGLGALVWGVTGAMLVMLGLWRQTRYAFLIVMLGGVVLGLWRGSDTEKALEVYQPAVGHIVNLAGRVSDDVSMGQRGEQLLRLDRVNIDGQVVVGMTWVSTASAVDIKRGDTVTVQGRLYAGFGGFAAAMYQAHVQKVERPEPGDVARRVRDWFADTVRLVVGEPQASLGLGYLLGQRRTLPPELDAALLATGLTHIVVASGYNLTILVRFARRLFMRVSKYLATLSASVMIIGFIAVTGLSASMSRAGLIAGLSLAAWYYGRKFHPLVLLPLAAAVTVMINPSYAWGDLGWQLSFAAFAGVLIVAPLLQRYFYGDKKPGVARQIFGETVSATIVTLPLLAYSFGYISLVAVLANMLVLPFVPLAMLLTFVTGVATLALPGLGLLIATPTEWLLGYMVWVAKYLADLPWALHEIQLEWWHVAIGYLFIIGACIYMQRVTRYNLRDSNIVE